ncbi:hypothetical protein AAY473_017082 [Plecturocebus cupreus]
MGQTQWLTPIFPALWEARMGGSLEARPGSQSRLLEVEQGPPPEAGWLEWPWPEGEATRPVALALPFRLLSLFSKPLGGNISFKIKARESRSVSAVATVWTAAQKQTRVERSAARGGAFLPPGGVGSGQGQSAPGILSHGGCDFGRRGQTDAYVEPILTRILELAVLGISALSRASHHRGTRLAEEGDREERREGERRLPSC